MPAVLPYPGVQIQELPPAARAITGVSTSVTAFLGRARRGPVDRAVRLFSFDDFARTFGGLWAESPMGHAVYQYYLNGGSEAVVVRLAPGATPATVALPAPGGAPVTFTFAAANAGTWGRNLRVTVSDPDPAMLGPGDAETVFNLTVREVDPAAPDDPASDVLTETFPNVSADPTATRWVGRVLEQGSRLLRVGTPSNRRPGNATQPLTGGGDGNALAATHFDDPGDANFRTNRRGLYALDAIETVNLLCLPPPAVGTDMFPATLTAASSYCDSRFTMLLVDPPSTWNTPTAAAARTGLTSLTSPSAAFYFPNIVMPDPLADGRPRAFAPCGAIAGVIARTDGSRGIWKAPAGQEAGLRGVTGFATSRADATSLLSLTDAQIGLLNPAGINALRRLGPAGPVVWGGRTARGADALASQFKYIPVRRLALHIEESLAAGTRWAVFEPNDEPLWSQLRLSIGGFMQQLFRRGAFQGADPQDAFFVKCDAETTTEADQMRGIVNVIVGFSPLKPAEFVVLKFQQITRSAA